MSKVLLKIKPPIVLLTCPIELGYKTNEIGYGCKFDGTYKAFKFPFMPETLIRVKKVFPQAKISEGQKYIDSMKSTLVNISEGKYAMAQELKDDLSKSIFNIDFKLDPFPHQVRGLYYLKFFESAAIFADCGSGKSALSVWDILLKLKNKSLKPHSVLIVSKLMTLFSGWKDCISEFSDLSSIVLWEPSKSKIIKGEKINVKEHGEKPSGKGKVKTITKPEYHFTGGGIAVLSSPRNFDPKKHVAMQRSYKEFEGIKFGTETLVPITRINIRAENIRKSISSHDQDIHIINHEGLLGFEAELTKRKYDMIIIDESTAIKNPKSKVVRALNHISENTKFKRILSGTPSPQGPQDLWSQFYFLDRGITLGANFKQFLNLYFNMVKMGSGSTYVGTKTVLRPDGQGKEGTLMAINNKMKNRIFRCKLRDCVSLPPLKPQVVDIFLEPSQLKHYESMKKDLFIEIEEGEKVSVNIDLAKIGKLRQITSGFILNKEKEVKELCKKNPKLAGLVSLLEEFDEGEKVVIFAVYRCEIQMLLAHFGKSALSIYGGVTDKQKFEAQDRFKKDKSIKVLICQPRSAAYGVDGLQRVCRYLVFYSIDYSADTLYQAIKRIERTGQTRKMFVYYLLAKNTIDTAVYRCVLLKDKIQQKTIDVEILKKIKGD